MLMFSACKKEDPVELPPGNYRPTIDLIEPTAKEFESSEPAIRVRVNANDDNELTSLEFRLYKTDLYGVETNIFHHWEPGDGTTCAIDKTVRTKIDLHRNYRLKVTAVDSGGLEAVIEHRFFLAIKDVAGPSIDFYYGGPHGGEFILKFDRTQNLTAAVFDSSVPTNISLSIKDKSTGEPLGEGRLDQFPNWSNQSPLVSIPATIKSNPFSADTIQGELTAVCRDNLGNISTRSFDCKIVN